MLTFLACWSPSPPSTTVVLEQADSTQSERDAMIRQLRAYGVSDERVLEAMRRVPRHEFVPGSLRDQAYADHPLPIGHDQTISQPFIVAHMTELVQPKPGDKALDVGTGSGYQAAVLAELVDEVYSIEIVCPLADEARERLKRLDYAVEVRCGDGWAGWEEHAPFDLIVLAAAPPEVPPALVEQLAPGGRLVLPVGPEGKVQQLVVLTKDEQGQTTTSRDTLVRFVPMTGEAQKR